MQHHAIDDIHEIRLQEAAVASLEADIEEHESELDALRERLDTAVDELKALRNTRVMAAREMKGAFDPDVARLWWYVHGNSPVRWVEFDEARPRHQAIMGIVNECELDEQHIIAWPFRKSDYRRDKRLLQRGA